MKVTVVQVSYSRLRISAIVSEKCVATSFYHSLPAKYAVTAIPFINRIAIDKYTGDNEKLETTFRSPIR